MANGRPHPARVFPYPSGEKNLSSDLCKDAFGRRFKEVKDGLKTQIIDNAYTGARGIPHDANKRVMKHLCTPKKGIKLLKKRPCGRQVLKTHSKRYAKNLGSRRAGGDGHLGNPSKSKGFISLYDFVSPLSENAVAAKMLPSCWNRG
eukprot:1129601-Amphidinium_carterae.1